jgi:predicted GTPase
MVQNPLTKAVVKAKNRQQPPPRKGKRVKKNYGFSQRATICGRVKGVNHHLQTLYHRIITGTNDNTSKRFLNYLIKAENKQASTKTRSKGRKINKITYLINGGDEKLEGILEKLGVA